MAFRPSAPFTVPMAVLTTSTRKVNGVIVKDRAVGRTFMASVRTFGGTESRADGLTVIEDTATVQTWYCPDIVAGAAVRTLADGSDWEILGSPEDIEMRHQWMQFKIRRIHGGA